MEGDINSLSTFLSFSKKALEQLGPKPTQPTKEQELRANIASLVWELLKKLDLMVLQELDENVFEIWEVVVKEAKRYGQPEYVQNLIHNARYSPDLQIDPYRDPDDILSSDREVFAKAWNHLQDEYATPR
jgi:hypothetical protein